MSTPVRCYCLRLLLLALLGAAWHGARADTPIRTLQSIIGNVNFVGTQVTMRDKNNRANPCAVSDPNSNLAASLSGIPSGAVIVSAHLYWAGSHVDPDYSVFMDNVAVTAPSSRRYYSTTIGNNFNYFAGAADVTEQVKLKGNGTYNFRGLTVQNGAPYCAVEGVLGGFSLVVIYAHGSQPFRLLNLYEGFQYIRYGSLTLNLSGFRVPDPLGTATARLAHVMWEGDKTLGSEAVVFNNFSLSDQINPSGNQFNSQSNINGDNLAYGIDFDAYTVGSPVIKAGDTTASTRFETGQDLILFNAEIVLMPNVPIADLNIEMVLTNELVDKTNATYAVTVSNLGLSTAEAPTVVTNVLPAGLSYVSGSGTGWSCSAIGQEVKCTNNAPITRGTALPLLTIIARVQASSGTITNSASVSGKTFDPSTSNNVASATGTVKTDAKFVFTDKACTAGVKFGEPGQCTTTLSPLRAGLDGNIFITAVTKGIPTALSASSATAVAIRFALSCHKPSRHAGVAATYAGVTLPLCTANAAAPTTWTTTSISMPAGAASVSYPFRYQDVGRVQLYLQAVESGLVGTALSFVSAPYEIRLTQADGAAFAAAPLADNAPAYARAGAPFGLRVGSYTAQGNPTPNYGTDGVAGFDSPLLAVGAASPQATAAMVSLPELEGAFDAIAEKSGIAAGLNFVWKEVGMVKLTPRMNPERYLGVEVTHVPSYVGRFYPDHFTTESSMMDCRANMKCETVSTDVSTAAYSREPLHIKVTARGVGGAATKNYQGVLARQLQLSAWANPKLGLQAMAGLSNVDMASSAFNTADGSAIGKPVFTLANGFVHTAPQAAWSAPASIFIRANEVGGDGVSSLSGSDPHEVGIRILSGRLLVPNGHGSERLDLPLTVRAQYWSGTHWEASTSDERSIIDPAPPKATFSNFSGALVAGSLSLQSGGAQKLVGGAARLNVRLSPAANGHADLVIEALPWLPSTKGRLKFGTYKSPLIYLREVH